MVSASSRPSSQQGSWSARRGTEGARRYVTCSVSALLRGRSPRATWPPPRHRWERRSSSCRRRPRRSSPRNADRSQDSETATRRNVTSRAARLRARGWRDAWETRADGSDHCQGSTSGSPIAPAQQPLSEGCPVATWRCRSTRRSLARGCRGRCCLLSTSSSPTGSCRWSGRRDRSEPRR